MLDAEVHGAVFAGVEVARADGREQHALEIHALGNGKFLLVRRKVWRLVVPIQKLLAPN